VSTPEEHLCTRCGLCCDGSLFADVELKGRLETSGLEAMGLEIEEGEDGAVLSQPCAALQGRRCGVYQFRPKCCRTFECRLLQEVKRGSIGIEEARIQIEEVLRRIQQIKGLLARAPSPVEDQRLSLKEDCQEAGLDGAYESLERLIQKTFLSGEMPSRKTENISDSGLI
jgi:Fe-S-cluster containining protein